MAASAPTTHAIPFIGTHAAAREAANISNACNEYSCSVNKPFGGSHRRKGAGKDAGLRRPGTRYSDQQRAEQLDDGALSPSDPEAGGTGPCSTVRNCLVRPKTRYRGPYTVGLEAP